MARNESAENVEMSHTKTDDEFVTVSRQSRKRKQTEESMDTSDNMMKRPYLPPVCGDKLSVNTMWYFCSSSIVSAAGMLNANPFAFWNRQSTTASRSPNIPLP